MSTKLLTLLIPLAFLPASLALAQDTIEFPETRTPIALGDTLEGALSPDMPVVAYAFEAEAGESVSINVDFDDLDGYLLLADDAGSVLAFNDDGRDIFNSGIPVYTFEEAGTYLIGVSSFGYVQLGQIEIEGTFTIALSGTSTTPIAIGDTVEGELSNDVRSANFTFTAEQGEIILISVASDAFDTTLSVTGTEGQTLALRNDDFAGETDSQVGPFVYYQPGEYVIQVSSFDAGDGGAFVLTTRNTEPTLLEVGETLDSAIAADNWTDLFAFEAAEGDVLDIVIASDSEMLDLQAVLFTPDGSLLDFSDDEVGLMPGFPAYEMPATGRYLLWVAPLSATVTEADYGAYTVTLLGS
jgi:hypothetical protein